MVKTIRISLDDSEHGKLEGVKGKKTWYDVLLRGIESIENWPSDVTWAQTLMGKLDEGVL